MGQIKDLQKQNAEKDKRITALESRVADLEQYSHMTEVIINGMEAKPRSYVKAVTADSGEPTGGDLESMEQQVITFLSSKGKSVNSKNIEACYPLQRKNQNEKLAVIIGFFSRKQNKTLLYCSRAES